MGIGEDVKEVFQDVGTEYSLIRDETQISSGEYLDYDLNAQVTKPFIREAFLEAALPYDTSGEVGDVLKFETTGVYYLLMNKTPEIFENETVSFSTVLYKANVSGELRRPSSPRDNRFHRQTQWETIKSNCYALLAEALYGHDLETDEEIGYLGIKRHELYIPRSAGIEVGDRYEPASGEYYRVETIRDRRYPGVDVAELGEDHR